MARTEHKISQEDAENIPHGVWRLVGQNETMRYWEADVELPGGKLGVIRKGEYLESEALLSLNEQLRNESSEHRYTAGLGSDKGGNMPMVHTASIPLNVYFQEIAQRRAAGDKDHLRWWLNQDDNAKFRVTTGQTRE